MMIEAFKRQDGEGLWANKVAQGKCSLGKKVRRLVRRNRWGS
jgi:hypothetical protein